MTAIPKRGQRIEITCIGCDKQGRMVVTSVRRNSENDDGSTCYTLKAKCQTCGYINGQLKPIWYNMYELGQVVF